MDQNLGGWNKAARERGTGYTMKVWTGQQRKRYQYVFQENCNGWGCKLMSKLGTCVCDLCCATHYWTRWH